MLLRASSAAACCSGVGRASEYLRKAQGRVTMGAPEQLQEAAREQGPCAAGYSIKAVHLSLRPSLLRLGGGKPQLLHGTTNQEPKLKAPPAMPRCCPSVYNATFPALTVPRMSITTMECPTKWPHLGY